jgi:hypothetical protein
MAPRRADGKMAEGFDDGAGPPRPQPRRDRDELLCAAPERGKEIAGLRAGVAIGEAAGERPVGIARRGPMSAAPQ